MRPPPPDHTAPLPPEADEVLVGVDADGIGTVTINRPKVANALRPSTMQALCLGLDRLLADSGVRAIVVTGAGRNFAAGADFAFLEQLLDTSSSAVSSSLYTWFKGTTERLWKSPKPTVAAVNGAAITVGCEIALACDVRVASADSRFGENWLQLGLIPPLGGAVLLPRLVGLTHAKRMILEAQIIDGNEALRIGLVDELVDAAAVLERARARALAMAEFPPAAFAAAKAALHRGAESTMDSEWVTNISSQVRLIGSEEFGARVRARTKRGPR